MSGRYIRYSGYLDLEVEWAATLPEAWGKVNLRWAAKIYAGGTPSKTNRSFWEDGTIPWLNSGSVNQVTITQASNFITPLALQNSSARWINRGSLVLALAGQGKTKGMVAQLGIDATCNQSMAAIVPARELIPRYLFWWLTSNYQNIRNLAGGDLRDGLNLKLLGDIQCPLPVADEQAQIANFLDYETAKIDALIEKQQQLIILLKEKRQAVISHAVTKGLNPDAPMRDSGVEWLGEVPAHWEILAVRHALRIDNGPRLPINRLERADMAGPYPYWGPTKVLDHIDHYRYEGARAIIGEDGDHFLKFAVWPMTHWATGRFNVNNHAHVVADGPKCSARWFYYSFLHRDIGADVIAQGVSRLKLTREGLSKLQLAVPPLHEQAGLIAHMEPVIAKVEKATVMAEHQVDLLQERRTALISAAVTGKIDVRGWTPPESATEQEVA